MTISKSATISRDLIRLTLSVGSVSPVRWGGIYSNTSGGATMAAPVDVAKLAKIFVASVAAASGVNPHFTPRLVALSENRS